MKPTSGPRVPDISVIDSEFIEKLYDTDGAVTDQPLLEWMIYCHKA